MTKEEWNAAVLAVSRESDRARAEWARAEYANAPNADALFVYSLKALAARDAMREARDASWGLFVARTGGHR